jgi:UDP-N-acetyl-D-glucosamine dehydrogenase
MRVAIIGQGYVGLTIAVGAAGAGHTVIGFDVNIALVDQLNQGRSHIEGISDSAINGFIGKGSYKASGDASVLEGSDVIVIAVPTPLDEKRNPDLSFVHDAADLIAKNVKTAVLIVNESTSYPGTLRKEIASRITGVDHLFASSPERVDPGNAEWGTKNTPRLIGGLTPAAVAKAREFYASFCDSIIEVSSPEVAEAAKIFENTFRQVNIALVNEFAQISDALGISSREVIEAAATKPYGFMPFSPGPGVGGHCIPVDPSYLAHVANQVGVPATFIKRANEVNLAMPAYVVKRVVAANGGSIAGKSVIVVGVSYKANVADTRETPAAAVIDLLRAQGATVVWHDDLVGSWRGESSDIAGH